MVTGIEAEGYDFVTGLITDWGDRTNRFDCAGEVLFEIRDGLHIVGVGGLNPDSTLGRIRHVFISPNRRGEGLGRRSIVSLVEHARGSFVRIRLRLATADGAPFYKAVGFLPAPGEADSTNELRGATPT